MKGLLEKIDIFNEEDTETERWRREGREGEKKKLILMRDENTSDMVRAPSA